MYQVKQFTNSGPVRATFVKMPPLWAVGDDTGPQHGHGLIENVRLDWGVIERAKHGDELNDWAELPGCGCRK